MKLINFKDFVGNDHIISLILKSAVSGKLPHALIFSGPEGVGKRCTAFSVGAFLFCENRKEDSFCGKCRNCALLSVGNHPDLYYIKSEDSIKEIGIDAIRELIKKIYMKPYFSLYKVVVIDNADMMTQEASNALLKILE